MKEIFRQIETPYVDAQTLLTHLADYQKPREWIHRMVKNGELIRLKNGFYLISDKIGQGAKRVIPYEQIANLLYGPSYVSLEWALSFYGLIPERVHTITSMTLGRAKEYRTPVGHFAYYPMRSSYYSVGIEQKQAAGFIGGFLIASPEKALADLVFLKCRGLNRDQLEADLFESRRIDREALGKFDKNLILEIAKNYDLERINHLIGFV